MLVTVRPHVVEDMDDGEELFLVFESTDPSGELEVAPIHGENLEWDLEEGNHDSYYPTDEDLRKHVGVLSCRTECELQWRGTKEELHQLAVETGVTNTENWEWCGSVTGQPGWSFQHKHQVN